MACSRPSPLGTGPHIRSTSSSPAPPHSWWPHLCICTVLVLQLFLILQLSHSGKLPLRILRSTSRRCFSDTNLTVFCVKVITSNLISFNYLSNSNTISCSPTARDRCKICFYLFILFNKSHTADTFLQTIFYQFYFCRKENKMRRLYWVYVCLDVKRKQMIF